MSIQILPPGVTGAYQEGCRECWAGLSQARSAGMGFRCSIHGDSLYAPLDAHRKFVQMLNERDKLLEDACKKDIQIITLQSLCKQAAEYISELREHVIIPDIEPDILNWLKSASGRTENGL